MQLHSCSTCGLSDLCLPVGLDKQQLSKLEGIISTNSPKQRGEVIVRQGECFSGVFAVKSGMCKSYRVDRAGVEYIQSFHLPGELFGLEAIHSQQYGFSVEALDTLVLCELQFDDLKALSASLPTLQSQLFELLSRELYQAYVNPFDHFEQRPLQKLAGFIQ